MIDSGDKKFLQLSQNLNKWFISHNYKGIDPYQIDEKYFKKIHIIPGIKIFRKILKPFHSLIPQKLFTNMEQIYLPKALGLIIGGNSSLYQFTNDTKLLNQNYDIIKILKNIRCNGYNEFAWGLPFEWGVAPRYSANSPFAIIQAIIANNLIDFYKIVKNAEVLIIIKSIMEYFLNENGYKILNDNNIAFYYSPQDNLAVNNIMAVVALALFRYNELDENEEYIIFADKMLNCLLQGQKDDGSWEYALKIGDRKVKTIDNRHSGFIIESLCQLSKYSDNQEIKPAYNKFKEYYLNNLFSEGLPKWSPTQIYPIDIHDVAQAIITLSEIGEFEKARQVIDFSFEKMFNGTDEFYFKYFEDEKVNKTVFFRWAQAWMYKAINHYLFKKYKFDPR